MILIYFTASKGFSVHNLLCLAMWVCKPDSFTSVSLGSIGRSRGKQNTRLANCTESRHISTLSIKIHMNTHMLLTHFHTCSEFDIMVRNSCYNEVQNTYAVTYCITESFQD